MINTDKPFKFFDDRNKREDVFPESVLFEDEKICLVKVNYQQWRSSYVLFEKETGKVLTENYAFLYAKSLETV